MDFIFFAFFLELTGAFGKVVSELCLTLVTLPVDVVIFWLLL